MGRLFEGYEEGLPFGPAAGAINGLSEEEITEKIIDVAKSPSGAVKWGSTSWNGGSGNEGRTYHHNEITGLTVNSMGLPNIGHVRAVRLQRELQPVVESYGKPLIPSFSPGKGEDPLEVLPAMASGFVEAGATIIEVNYSCPNKFVEGGKLEPVLGHDLDTMFELDELIVREVGPDITINRKLPPYVGEKRVLLPEVAERFSALGARAVNGRARVMLGLFNTIGGQQVLDELGDPALSIGENRDNLGGASGRAFGQMSTLGLQAMKGLLHPDIATVSSVGVESGKDVYWRVNVLDADFTEGVTVLWENEKRGIKFGETIRKIAEQYAEEIEIQNEGRGFA